MRKRKATKKFRLVSPKTSLHQLELFGATSTVAASLLIITLFAVTGLQHVLLRSTSVAAVISVVLVDEANTDRLNNSIGTLALSPTLTTAAQAKADDMAQRGYFSHTSPEGRDPWYWFQQAGYSFDYAGENLAVDFSDSKDVEQAWMNSLDHRKNLLDGHFTEIGVAVARGTYEGHPTTFVVQMFGTPSSRALAPVRSITATAAATETAIGTTLPQVLGESSAPEKNPTALAAGAVRTSPLQQIVQQPTADAPHIASASRPPVWGFIAASPKSMLRNFYYAFGFLILLALFIVTRLEFRIHHTRKFIVAGSLLFMMSGLFIVADRVLFSSPIVVQSGAEVSTS